MNVRRHAEAIVAISALLVLTLVLGVMSATAAAPVVTIDPPSSVSYTSAHVAGKVNPEDQETSYRFQYSANPEGEGWLDAAFQGPLAAGAGNTSVSDDLTGLQPGTEYFVRLVAESADGQAISAEPNPSFTTLAVAAPAVTISAPSAITGTTAHFEGQIDPEAPVGNPAAFDVNWHFECTPACPGLSGGTIPADSSSHTVEANATGLKAGTAYEVTLVASNAGGQTSAGPESFATPTVAPEIAGFFAGPLYTEANLFASINPGGLETSYHFEYGATAAYGRSTPTKSIPAGSDPVAVKAGIAGLSPSSAYHAKLVATNANGVTESGDRAFVTQSDALESNCGNEAVRVQQNARYLPECRAYELVSPVDKNASYVQNQLQVDDDGGAVAWASLGAYAGTPGIDAEAVYVGRRTGPGQWSTTPFFPRFGETYRPGFQGFNGGYTFSDDLRKMAFVTFGSFDPQDHDAEVSEFGALSSWDMYLTEGDGSAVWVSHGTAGVGPNEPINADIKGISRDGSTVFFVTSEALSPEVTPGSGIIRLYRWREGTVELVSHDENGTLIPSATWLGGNGTFAYTINGDVGPLPDAEAVSRDGSEFVYGGVPSGPASQLYLHRANGDVVRITSSQKTGSVGQPSASPTSFVSAVSDLGLIYFRSADRLTDDAPVGGGDYVYDVASGELSYSNWDDYVEGGFGGGFVRASEDGRYVYFASELSLASGASEAPERLNLYVRGPGGVKYIGPLSGNDRIFQNTGTAAAGKSLSGLSADGERLVFRSSAQMTGYDTKGKPQIYLYDAAAEEVTCVSCNPTVPGSAGEASFGTAEYFPPTPRVITDDGDVVAFESTEQLVPGDTNDASDIYVYSEGRLRLISDGMSTSDSTYVGMSRDGTDLFFKTRSSLVRADTDRQLFDMYDARIGGGALEPSPASACSGDSCQEGAPPPPAVSAPASNSVSGPGNATPRKHGKHKKKKQRGKRGKNRPTHKGGKTQGGKHRQGDGRRVRSVNDNQGGVR